MMTITDNGLLVTIEHSGNANLCYDGEMVGQVGDPTGATSIDMWADESVAMWCEENPRFTTADVIDFLRDAYAKWWAQAG